MQKIAYLLFIGLFLCINSGQSQETSSPFKGWRDTIFPMLENRDFAEATELAEAVKKEYGNQTDSKDLAFANLIIAKMYQLRARLDVSEEALSSARQIITSHYPENDSLQFFLLRYEADQLMVQYYISEADSLLSLAEPRGEKAFGENAFQMALFYSSKQMLYGISGKYYECLEAAQKALQIAYVVFDSLDAPLAGFENNVGISYFELEKLKLANEHYNRSLKIMKANRGEKDIGVAQIYNNLGSVENSLHHHKAALVYLQKGIDIYNSLNTTEYNDVIIDLYYNGAYSYTKMGDYKRAENYMSQAARYLNENVPRYQAYLSAISQDMSMHARKGEDYNKAEEKALLGLEQQIAAYGEDSDELIYPLMQLSFNALDQNNFDKAISHIKRSINLLEINDRIVSENGGDFYDWHGEILELKSEYAKALEKYLKALKIFRNVYGETNPNISIALSSIGNCYLRLGKIAQSRMYLDSAWQNIILPGASISPGHLPNYNQIDAHIYLRDIVQDECQFNYNQFNSHNLESYLQKGLQAAFLADKWLDETRENYTSLESSAGLLSDNFHLYEWGMIFSEKLFKETNNASYLDTAFYFAEKSKSASLFELVRDIELENEDKIPGKIIDQLKDFEIDLRNLKTQITDEKSYGDDADTKQIKEWETQLFNIAEAYQNLKDTVSTEYADYFNLRYNTAVVNLKDLQKVLPANTTLLEYMVGDSAVHIFVIDQNSTNYLQVDKNFDISNSISRLNKSIIDRNNSLTNQITDSLYQVIFEPVENSIKNENVVIIPEGPLHYLNFEVLKDREKNNYLINYYNISYENSSSYYYLNHKDQNNYLQGNQKGWLGLAPGFNENMKEVYKSAWPKEEWDEEYLGLIRQPNSEILISEISKKEANSKSYIGVEANEANLFSNIGKFSTIHFSTHAEINDKAPNRSHLVLAKPKDPKSKSDGYLDISEIFTLPIHSNLVVLTACNTGLGKLYKGEGMVSLARGFQFAGAKNIIMSLWSVDEQQSTVLMDKFYDEYDDGKSVAKSLRNAKLNYLKSNKGELAQPYYWAGLVAIGPDVVSNHSNFLHNWWIWVAGILLIALLVSVIVRRGKND